ncbi:MAG: 4,5-DOPA dioxygenase extradiol [Rubrivivax sp.]
MRVSHPTRRALLSGATSSAAVAALASWAELAAAAGGPAATRMPAIFIGHGSPMNALRDNGFTRHLRQWGETLPRPRAILSVSAHWLTPGSTEVAINEKPPTIHDFGGFPAELHAMQYPAPGAPALAREAASRVKSARVRHSGNWGLDHGTWTVLHHLFPRADVPVFQLSIDMDAPGPQHLAIGRDLAALRDLGVLVMGSGNIVHNLRATDRDMPDSMAASRPWARAFDAAVAKALAARDDKALAHPMALDMSAPMAVPTPDHYLPMLYSLGAAAPDEAARSVFQGFQSGTLGMRCLQFG